MHKAQIIRITPAILLITLLKGVRLLKFLIKDAHKPIARIITPCPKVNTKSRRQAKIKFWDKLAKPKIPAKMGVEQGVAEIA